MIGFYIIRKLIEAKKLSNEIVSTKVNGFKSPNIGKIVHMMNNHRFYEYYNFDNRKPYKFDLIFLANQIVHSYIFSPVFDPEEFNLTGIHFNSDKDRNEWLYEINIDTIINLFDRIGNNYPSFGTLEYDEVKKDYKVFQKDKVDHLSNIKEVKNILRQFKTKK